MLIEKGKKSRIVIPQLSNSISNAVKKNRPKEQNKQNIHQLNDGSTNNVFGSVNQNNHINAIVLEPKMKVSQYLDQSHHSQNFSNGWKNATKDIHSKLVEIGSNNSTQRGGSSSSSHSSVQSSENFESRKGSEFLKLEGLIKSDKMFVNPDRWCQFIDRAMNDQEFQKALNIFLYTYFIHHYN